MVVELESENEIKRHNLSNIDRIGEWQISCSVPNSDAFKVGVISPIEIDEDISDLSHFVADNNCQIEKVERMMKTEKDGSKSPSLSVKLTFKSKQLPKSIKFYHFRYNVRIYIPNPVQCYRCQRLGHTALACKAPRPRCLFCAGNHKQDDCPDKNKVHCSNCKEAYRANARKCKYLEHASFS